jgi:hypothetical protein
MVLAPQADNNKEWQLIPQTNLHHWWQVLLWLGSGPSFKTSAEPIRESSPGDYN